MVTMQVRSIAMLQRRLHPCQNGVTVAMLHAVEKNLSCSTTHATGCTDKSRGMSPVGDQTVAAIANDESLQVRVRKGTPPRREVNSAPFGTQGAKTGCLQNP